MNIEKIESSAFWDHPVRRTRRHPSVYRSPSTSSSSKSAQPVHVDGERRRCHDDDVNCLCVLTPADRFEVTAWCGDALSFVFESFRSLRRTGSAFNNNNNN